MPVIKGIGNTIGNFLGFDQGGVVPGPVGQPRMAMVHGGETILPTHKKQAGNGRGFGNVTINISGNTLLDDNAGEKLASQIMRELKLNMRFG